MLQIQNISFHLGGRALFERATLSIQEGQKIGLVGRNGTGKTTLLKRILRLNNGLADSERLKIAVIVNDMGMINLDADEIKNSKLIQEDAEMVEMQKH